MQLMLAVELAVCLYFIGYLLLTSEIGTPINQSLQLTRHAMSVPTDPQLRAGDWTLFGGVLN